MCRHGLVPLAVRPRRDPRPDAGLPRADRPSGYSYPRHPSPVVTPTLSVAPVEVGTGGPSVIAGDPADPSLDGLPVGAQLVGPRFDDRAVLAASAAVERQRPLQDRYPGRDEGTVN